MTPADPWDAAPLARCTTCGERDELDARGECSGCHRDECSVCGRLAALTDDLCPACARPECPYCGEAMTETEVRDGHCAACWRRAEADSCWEQRGEEGR